MSWTHEQREEVARILTMIDEEGMDHPRNLDAALDAISDVLEPEHKLHISVCTYQSGDFEVMLKDKTGLELMLSGNQELSATDLDFVNFVAPACVWTSYARLTPA